MRIKLAILEKDLGYLTRIVSVFSTKYADKFQIYSYTDADIAFAGLATEKIDVFVANDAFDIDLNNLPKRCCFAYFVDNADIDSINGQRTICKFQKAELIYKQILSLYSENAANISGLHMSDDSCRLVTFSSPAGGTGTSTFAAAYALFLAEQKKKVLFLSFEDFGSSDIFFSGEGQFDMTDVIFAIKSKKANLAMKLESYIKQDSRGVYFFSASKFSLDMLELTHEERIALLSELQHVGSYDCIVLDCSFGLDKAHKEIYKKSNSVIMITDGTETANLKTNRAYAAIQTMDQTAEIPITNRFALFYNKFSNKISQSVDNSEIKELGGAPVYAHATTAQILSQLVTLDIFNKIDI